MAFKLVGGERNTRDGSPFALIAQYVLDSAADVSSLPAAAAGSTAIVAAKDGPIYMVNASGSWEEL